jgi:hypothetical protein
MRPMLIDRDGRHAGYTGQRVALLSEIFAVLKAGA